MSEQELPASRVLGAVADFHSFPATVNIDRDPYFLVQIGEGQAVSYRLVSAICPHAGGLVRPHEHELICPLHFWAFDIQTGESTNVPGEHLECRTVEIKDGQFTVQEQTTC